MQGVTQLRDVVYVVTGQSSAIQRFNAKTHQRLADIVVTGLRDPCDIAACKLTSQLYVADNCECVWRVSSDGVDIQRWLPKSPSDMIKPHTLSVTSWRLLVMLKNDRQLRQFDAARGDELERVRLPDYMKPLHAVESPTRTFIVSYWTDVKKCQVCEVSTTGYVLREFSGPLGWPQHIAVDGKGNIFVADSHNGHIRLLDAQLALRRVIFFDEYELSYRWPDRLCYMEQSRQLLVGFFHGSVAVFHVPRRYTA